MSYLSILDVAIALIIISGAILGFKNGFIKSVTSFIGTLIAIICAFILKNPLSVLMYTYLPFFKFSGTFEGLTSLNILLYEAIAFLLVLSILSILVKTLIKISNIIEKLLNATIILGIPSKLLGALFGAFEIYLFVFIAIFCINQVPNTNFLVSESHISKTMLKNTPILSNAMENAYNTFNDIHKIALEYNNSNNVKVADSLAFEVLLKNEIITKENAQKLIDSKKIDNELSKQILNNYKGE